jgi:hypothetical protein
MASCDSTRKSFGNDENPFNLPPAWVGGGCAGIASAVRYATALTGFVARYQFLLDAHPNDFLTSLPMARLPIEWAAEYCALGEPTDLLTRADGTEDVGERMCDADADRSPRTLVEWFAQARRFQMPRQPAVRDTGHPVALAFPSSLRVFTGAKKCHEVELMTRAVLAAANAAGGCRRVMELGAGVGRLSSVLAMEHRFAVVGVDCSQRFTLKAERRTQWLLAHRRRARGARCAAAACAHISDDMDAAALGALWQSSRDAAATTRTTPSAAREVGVDAAGADANANTDADADADAAMGTRDAPAGSAGAMLLVGMHTCGELAPSMLKLFANSLRVRDAGAPGLKALRCAPCTTTATADASVAAAAAAVAAAAASVVAPTAPVATIRGIVNVGCCYNLLGKQHGGAGAAVGAAAAAGANWCITEFPLSATLRSLPCAAARLTRRLCSAAAQSTSPGFVKIARAQKGGALHRPRRLARALLQRFLEAYHPALCENAKRAKLKTSKFNPFAPARERSARDAAVVEERCSYAAYVRSAMASLGASAAELERAPDADALNAEWDRAWAEHAASLKLFHCMAEAVAPMVEALLLLDRAIFLAELPQKPTVRLFPLFDPAISPRNLCLTAFDTPRA